MALSSFSQESGSELEEWEVGIRVLSFSYNLLSAYSAASTGSDTMASSRRIWPLQHCVRAHKCFWLLSWSSSTCGPGNWQRAAKRFGKVLFLDWLPPPLISMSNHDFAQGPSVIPGIRCQSVAILSCAISSTHFLLGWWPYSCNLVWLLFEFVNQPKSWFTCDFDRVILEAASLQWYGLGFRHILLHCLIL